ncbi:decapping endonuclease targeting mRNA [Malassezia yamatoensis]|uniref:Decapping nuclease n=1 Tax=Malassezia yamatoensis TaxID=253288 RepID=A0AAJ5YWR3_9BASI|nr:decapping endonuclease targeting mRNA [Malassezia yamatoensis]
MRAQGYLPQSIPQRTPHVAPPVDAIHTPILAAMQRPSEALSPVRIQQPTLIATFSYDAEKRLCLDDRSKRWYRDPPTNANHGNGTGKAADLNYGFESFEDQPHIPDPLDSVLYTLMRRSMLPTAPPPVAGPNLIPSEALEMEVLRANVITWRGILTKLCTAWSCHVQAPPMFREGFELNVMMLGDTLIMEEVPPTVEERTALSNKSKSMKQRRATYFGYSFESYCTLDTSHPIDPEKVTEFSASPAGWGADVNTNQQWCHIVKTRLGDSRLILGGEVDCVKTEKANEKGKESVLELKTSMVPRNEQDQMMLQVKMLRMYMQSFLLGVESIVIGFRDPKGTLVTHEQYRTTDLPRMVRNKPGQWNANDNLAFGSCIIQWLRQSIGRDMERWSYLVSDQLKLKEQNHGRYPWRVHRTTTSFLGHLPLPCVEDAEVDYPIYRVSFQPPFQELTLRYIPPVELQLDGRRANRCGIVPSEFYRWATTPMEDIH